VTNHVAQRTKPSESEGFLFGGEAVPWLREDRLDSVGELHDGLRGLLVAYPPL